MNRILRRFAWGFCAHYFPFIYLFAFMCICGSTQQYISINNLQRMHAFFFVIPRSSPFRFAFSSITYFRLINKRRYGESLAYSRHHHRLCDMKISMHVRRGIFFNFFLHSFQFRLPLAISSHLLFNVERRTLMFPLNFSCSHWPLFSIALRYSHEHDAFFRRFHFFFFSFFSFLLPSNQIKHINKRKN